MSSNEKVYCKNRFMSFNKGCHDNGLFDFREYTAIFLFHYLSTSNTIDHLHSFTLSHGPCTR